MMIGVGMDGRLEKTPSARTETESHSSPDHCALSYFIPLTQITFRVYLYNKEG